MLFKTLNVPHILFNSVNANVYYAVYTMVHYAILGMPDS